MSDTPNNKIQKLQNVHSYTKLSKDFYIGAIRVLTQTYIPKWKGEDEAYDIRLATTKFVNLYSPIIDSIVGMVTKKKPTIKSYDSINLEDIDLKNNSIYAFIKSTIKQSLIQGLVFTAVETDTGKNRSYAKNYKYDQLCSYKIKNNVLTQIVFKETIEVEVGKFGAKEQYRYTVFSVGGGSIWYSDSENEVLTEKGTWENSLKEIPIIATITGKELSEYEVIPKFYDIALMNKVHVNMNSNLANILNVVSNPVAMFFGELKEGILTIGVKDALVFKDKKTEGAEYLEAKGYGIAKIQGDIKETELQIDKLTFNMLVSDDSKTTIDAKQNQSKNTSFLNDVALEVESNFIKILNWMLELENKQIPSDATFEMNKDFDLVLMDIETAYKLRMANEISRETFYYVWKNGKLPKDFTIESENQKIERDTI
jgi:hypothetical protein